MDELFDTLTQRLNGRSRQPFNQIILDAAEGLHRITYDATWDPEEWAEGDIERLREQFSRALKYCSDAKQAGKPLDVLEVINDGHEHDFPPTVSFVLQVPLKRLWRDLAVGFIRNEQVLNRAGYWVPL